MTLLTHRPSCASPEFNCGSRLQQLGEPEKVMDGWKVMPNGDRCCTYCGSLHEDDLFDILEHYGNGEPDYTFSITNKSYKIYANRPGVMNASQGGIKFYGWHANVNQDVERKEKIYKLAIARFNRSMERLYLASNPGLARLN